MNDFIGYDDTSFSPSGCGSLEIPGVSEAKRGREGAGAGAKLSLKLMNKQLPGTHLPKRECIANK